MSGELRALLIEAKSLGVRYQRLTGKPLGVTGEVAELEAAEKLGLRLCMARTPGYDALDDRTSPARRVQIKGRAVDRVDRYRGRCPALKCGDRFDDALLVLLDRDPSMRSRYGKQAKLTSWSDSPRRARRPAMNGRR